MALAAVLAAAFAGLSFLPANTVEEENRRIAESENRAREGWRRVLTDYRSGKASAAVAADRIERDVLPPWDDARDRLLALAARPIGGHVHDAHPQVYRLRREAWESAAADLRARGTEPGVEFARRWREADRIEAAVRQWLAEREWRGAERPPARPVSDPDMPDWANVYEAVAFHGPDPETGTAPPKPSRTRPSGRRVPSTGDARPPRAADVPRQALRRFRGAAPQASRRNWIRAW